MQEQLQQSVQSSVPVHKAKEEDKSGPSSFIEHCHRPGLGEDACTAGLLLLSTLIFSTEMKGNNRDS